MATKVKELDNTKQGDRAACSICHRRTDRIYEDELWSRRHLGARPLTSEELRVLAQR